MRREITLLENCLEEAAWLVGPCPLVKSSNQSHRTASSVAMEHDSELGLRGSLKSGRISNSWKGYIRLHEDFAYITRPKSSVDRCLYSTFVSMNFGHNIIVILSSISLLLSAKNPPNIHLANWIPPQNSAA